MFKKLLCLIGLHYWLYSPNPGLRHLRHCSWCKKTDDVREPWEIQDQAERDLEERFISYTMKVCWVCGCREHPENMTMVDRKGYCRECMRNERMREEA